MNNLVQIQHFPHQVSISANSEVLTTFTASFAATTTTNIALRVMLFQLGFLFLTPFAARFHIGYLRMDQMNNLRR